MFALVISVWLQDGGIFAIKMTPNCVNQVMWVVVAGCVCVGGGGGGRVGVGMEKYPFCS